jgi:hypothetical protein
MLMIDYQKCWTMGWHYRTSINTEITIPDLEGLAQTIENLGTSDVMTVVGVAQAANSNMIEQVRILKEDADDVGD